VKPSLIAIHTFDASREAMLTFLTNPASTRNAYGSCDVHFLESALFTQIDLDQVQPNLAWFIKRLELDEPVSVDVIIPSNVIMFVVGGAGAVS